MNIQPTAADVSDTGDCSNLPSRRWFMAVAAVAIMGLTGCVGPIRRRRIARRAGARVLVARRVVRAGRVVYVVATVPVVGDDLELEDGSVAEVTSVAGTKVTILIEGKSTDIEIEVDPATKD